MLSNGDKIGPYIIRERAGQGGMATVYKAWHEGLHRFEALKVPRGAERGAHDSAYIQRLLSEARVAAGLHHPHIVAIHGVSEPLAPIPFFAMDWVQGRDLAKILAEKRAFSLPETIQILESVANALDYAHSCGVVHRDIKPANILIAENSEVWVPKVVDFGISRAAEDEDGAGETKLTRSGMIVGTPEYMSPEQAGSGALVDNRTDLYSLAVVAYEMLCGAPPFTAGSGISRLSILISHVRDIAPLFEKCPDFPRAAGDVLLRALAKSPDDRPASCAAFIAELRAATAQIEEGKNAQIFAVPTTVEERTPFDSARFERDESATVFERPLSIDAAPRTISPQKSGAATLENSSDSIYSLRARLEAAGAKSVLPDKANLETAPQSSSPAEVEAIPQKMKEPPISPVESSPIPQKMKELPASKSAARGTSRIALFAGLGGVVVGGALVLMMFGRDYDTLAKASSGEIEISNAPISVSAVAPKNSDLSAEKSSEIVAKKRDLASPDVSLPRLRTIKISRTREIAYATQTRRSAARPAGSRLITRRGQSGARQVELQISYRGDQEIARKQLSQRVVRAPVAQIEVLGTRIAPPRIEAPKSRARIRAARRPQRAEIASPRPKTTRAQNPRRAIKTVRRNVPTQKRRAVREAPLPP